MRLTTRGADWIAFLGCLLLQSAARAIPCTDYQTTLHWSSIIPIDEFVNMDLVDPILYVGGGGSLRIFHVGEPSLPTMLGSIPFPEDYPAGFRVRNNLLLAGTSDRILRIYDVGAPGSPVFLSSIMLDEEIGDLEIEGTFAYVSTRRSMTVVDLLSPESPTIGGAYIFPQLVSVRRLALHGHQIYVQDGQSNIVILDVSDAGQPTFVNYISFPGGYLRDIQVQENILYSALGKEGGLSLVDIGNSLAPEVLSFISMPDLLRLSVSGDLVLASDWSKAIVFNVSVPSDPIVIAEASLVGQVAGFAVIASPRLFLMDSWPMGIGVAQTQFLENPDVVGSLNFVEWPLDVHVTGNLGLVTMNPSQLKTISLDDPENPSPLGSVDLAINMSTCVTSEGMIAYAGTGTGPVAGVTAVDISNPTAPFRIQSVFIPGTISDIDVENRLVAAGLTFSGFALVDFTDPESPQVLSTRLRRTYVNCVEFLSENLLIVGEGDQLSWFDVQDPSSPAVVDSIPFSFGVAQVEKRGPLIVAVGYNALYRPTLYTIDKSGSGALIGSVLLPVQPSDLAVQEDLAYLSFGGYEAEFGGLIVVDITYPQNPRLFGMLTGPFNGTAISLGNGFVFGTRDSVGIAIFPAQCETTPLLISDLDARWNGREIELSWFAPWAESDDPFRVFRGFSRFGPFSPRDLPIRQRNGKFLCIDDDSRPQTTYAYKLQILDQTGDELWAGPVEVLTPPGRTDIEISMCHPNPFRQSTSVQLTLNAPTSVRFEIYDTAGRKVFQSHETAVETGAQQLTWEGSDEFGDGVGAGVYWMKIVSGSNEIVRKVVKLN